MSLFKEEASNFSISKDVYEIGSKQIIIDQLRKYLDVFKDLLVRVKSREYMIDLFLHASKQLFECDEAIFMSYEKEQLECRAILEKYRKTLEKKIEFLNVHISRIKNELSLKESNLTLEESKKEFEKWSSIVLKDLEKKPKFIKEYLMQNQERENLRFQFQNEKNNSQFVKANNKLSNSVKIMVLGKRGAGKSSFINSIRNIDEYVEHDGENIAKTGVVECTELCNFYKYDFDPETASSSNKESNFYLIDVPGVGTNKFPSDDYISMLLSLEPDVLVYLFQGNLEDIDYKIISEIKKKRKGEKIFLVKNKIDLDFEEWLHSDKNKLDIENFSEEQLEFMTKEHWPVFRNELDNGFISFLIQNKLDLIDKCYFISSSNFYRQFFDFDSLIYDLLNYLPPEKSSRFRDALNYVFNKTSFITNLFKKYKQTY